MAPTALSTSTSSATTSIAPVARLGFSLPSLRAQQRQHHLEQKLPNGSTVASPTCSGRSPAVVLRALISLAHHHPRVLAQPGVELAASRRRRRRPRRRRAAAGGRSSCRSRRRRRGADAAPRDRRRKRRARWPGKAGPLHEAARHPPPARAARLADRGTALSTRRPSTSTTPAITARRAFSSRGDEPSFSNSSWSSRTFWGAFEPHWDPRLLPRAFAAGPAAGRFSGRGGPGNRSTKGKTAAAG